MCPSDTIDGGSPIFPPTYATGAYAKFTVPLDATPEQRASYMTAALWQRNCPTVLQQSFDPIPNADLPDVFGPRNAAGLPLIAITRYDRKAGKSFRDHRTWPYIAAHLLLRDGTKDDLDVRDFPKGDATLGDVAPALLQQFRSSTQFPGRASPTLLSDLACHVELEQRDALEKCYAATGRRLHDEASTCLHMDEAGAINTMVWAGPKYLSDSAAAVWIFWPPASIDALRSAAREDGGDYHGDPIFTQTLSITEQFIQSVMKKADSKDAPIILHQNPGDTVVVPAGFAHQNTPQVLNLRDSFKIARDIIVPWHTADALRLQDQRAMACAHHPALGNDGCVLLPTILHSLHALLALASGAVQERDLDAGGVGVDNLPPIWPAAETSTNVVSHEMRALALAQRLNSLQLAAELRSLSRDVNHLRQELRRAEGAVTIAAVKREVSSAFLRASELVSQTGRQLGV
ncbi:hypothetical protein OC835_007212 [Tilletia horrida]|nr:hypothetical protein OC835_007212 [Tilletia horrida]